MMKKESAATEVIGFALVLGIVITGFVIWMFIAVPIQGENKEVTHNDGVVLEMADLKYDIDTLLIDHIRYSTRTVFLSNSPKGDKAMVTLLPEFSNLFSTGVVTIEAGKKLAKANPLDPDYSELKVTFATNNMYADNIELVYEGGELYSNGKRILSRISTQPYSDFNLISAVPSDFSRMVLADNEFSVIIFRLDEVQEIGTNRVGIFNIDVKGTYYG